MLFETLSQPLILLWIVASGILCGFIFDLSNLLFKLSNCNKIFRYFLDFFSVIITAFVLFLVILKINYGDLRLYEILIFTLFVLLQRATIGKLLAKTLKI